MTRAAEAWDRFWFGRLPTSTLALVRVAFGLVTLVFAASLAPSLGPFFHEDGIFPTRLPAAKWGVWTLLDPFTSDLAVLAVFLALVVASVCLILGYRTRLAAAATFVCLMSLERRNPFIFNSGHGLLRLISLYLMLAPSGASLSLDRLRTARDRFWEFPERAAWPLRLMQVQLSAMYITAAWDKLRGETWADGTAVSYALRDLPRFEAPSFVTNTELISTLATWATPVTELAIGVLVWNRRLRPWALAAGLLFHIGIALTIRVGVFSLAVFVLYVAFIPPETANALILRFRGRLRERGLAALSPLGAARVWLSIARR
jgi:Vitamin K-dependent gamma-carboxylase